MFKMFRYWLFHYLLGLSYILCTHGQYSPEVSNEIALPHPYCPKIDDPLHAVMLPHPNDCRKYYSCIGGLTYVQKCPENLYWSAITYRCDKLGLAYCQNGNSKIGLTNVPSVAQTLVPTAQTPPTITPPLPSLPSSSSVSIPQYSYVPNCQQIPNYPLVPPYYPLSSNYPTISNYPPIPNYSAIPSYSSIPNYSNIPTYIPTTVNEPKTPEAQCSQINNIGYAAFPGDCHKFITCGSLPIVLTCPSNLYWSQSLLRCDTTPTSCN